MNKFQTVVIDPPWYERGGGKIKRGADKHYPLMKTPQIIETIIKCEHWPNVANPSHLYMWVTNNYLAEGLKVIDALGYRYITNFVWIKPSFGLGQYFRGQHELCLFATKGQGAAKLRTTRKDLSSMFVAPKSKHSKKPFYSYFLIEERSKGPYLEIFSRQERPNWVVWGNEV